MTHKTRVAALAVAAIGVIAMLQLPALAHHKEGHQGGAPSPSPSPTQSPTPAPAGNAASPCATVGPMASGTRLSCSAVSADGVLDIRGVVAAEPVYYECSLIEPGCGWPWSNFYPGVYFAVGIDTGTGFQEICSGEAVTAVTGTCEGKVAVPAGTPIECVMIGDVWSRETGVGELSCF